MMKMKGTHLALVIFVDITFVLVKSDLIKNNGSFSGDTEPAHISSFYYVSQNSAAWSTAGTDCRVCLGETGTLAYIETESELRVVTKLLLESGDTVSKLWIGGLYNVTTQTFAWGNGVTLQTWAPWAAGHPNTRTALSRILASAVGVVKFETDFQTRTLRYLCESKMETVGKSCIGMRRVYLVK